MSPLFGAIEAGGTKFVCAVGTGPDDLRDKVRFPTTTPEETLGKTIDYFKQAEVRYGKLDSIGIACFGPVDLNLGSPTYGYITSTPKPGWANVDVVGPLKDAFHIPVGFDTDVNVAGYGEWRYGAAQGLDTFIYLTIGTGIGGGGLVNGKMMHGLVHPEMGHILLPLEAGPNAFTGICPFHGHCFEGLASGPAMKARWGVPAETLPLDHEAWKIEARTISVALTAYIVILSPQRILLGGGVMQQKQLFPAIHQEVRKILNGYVQSPQITEHIADYIVEPGLGTKSGILGAIALAEDTAKQS